jgi:hypothetical protein
MPYAGKDAKKRQREYGRQYYLRNKAKHDERCRLYYANNKSAQDDYRRKYYLTNKKEIRRRVDDWRDQRRQLLDQLRDRPCMDCGGKFPGVVMEFDHRDSSTKVGEISTLIYYKLEVLMAEIEKCDHVCANCHRIRTWKRSWRERPWT